MLQLLLLLLPIAATSGWIAGYRYKKSIKHKIDDSAIPPGYFAGLNYLINEQPDKAVDVFIKVLSVNTDTVETHLALGNLFRRRGEVDRAIRIHQNLIARPQLSEKHKMQALSELAHDYLRAGVFDRAEHLFLKLIEMSGYEQAALKSLISIYQQQRDWRQAIASAKKLETLAQVKMDSAIAHYYCELAEGLELEEGYKHLKKALKHDGNCVRANIVLARNLFNAKQYKQSIKAARAVYDQDPEYVSEVIDILAASYKEIGADKEFIKYLSERVLKSPRIYYVLAMAENLRERNGDSSAINYLADQLPRCLSLRGLKYMLDLYINHADSKMKEQLSLLKEFTKKLLENKPVYRCTHCGFSSKNLYWQCPSCRRWNVIKPIHGLEGD